MFPDIVFMRLIDRVKSKTMGYPTRRLPLCVPLPLTLVKSPSDKANHKLTTLPRILDNASAKKHQKPQEEYFYHSELQLLDIFSIEAVQKRQACVPAKSHHKECAVSDRSTHRCESLPFRRFGFQSLGLIGPLSSARAPSRTRT